MLNKGGKNGQSCSRANKKLMLAMDFSCVNFIVLRKSSISTI